MKRILILALSVLLFIPAAAFAQFAGGDGSSGNPYQVSDAGQLSVIRSYPGNYFIQTADIDLAWGGEGWLPIGNNSSRWYGYFDGNGYKITNLQINRPSTNYIGLFGYVENANIQNVWLDNVSVSGAGATGSLIGFCGTNTFVSRCYSTGNVYGGDAVGGLIGWVSGSNISRCYTSCYTQGNKNIGGLIGRTDSVVSISDCYARGGVYGSSTDTFNDVGGLIGLCYDTDVSRTYSTGSVTGLGTFTGGLIGYNNYPSAVISSYWNTETSGQTTSAGGTGKTTAEMKSQPTFAGWDFSTPVWRMYPTLNNGYPYLGWQDMPGILTLIPNPPAGGTVTGDGAYEESTPVWVTATPTAPYYQFRNWTNDIGGIESTDPNFTYPMPEGDMTLTANFEKYFSEETCYFNNVSESTVSWGDYDNDGDLDALVVGLLVSGTRYAGVYRNDGGGVFTDIGAGLTGVRYSASSWCDYDSDGWLDIIITGWESSAITSKIYRNGGGWFYDIGAGLPGVNSGAVAWADYDNDGDQDLLISGWYSDGSDRIMRLYQNNAGSFSNVYVFDGLEYGSMAWADYDNDGDQDILCSGLSGSGAVSVVYRNDAGTFNIAASLQGLYFGTVAWGDYDNDGDPDILLTGVEDGGKRYSRIYRNDMGGFTNISADLVYLNQSSAAWADIDNDGILDIILSGIDNDLNPFTKIYNISSDTVSEKTNIGLTGAYYGSIACGDYDNDGDVDLIVSGCEGADYTTGRTRIYKNNYHTINTAPSAPANLSWTLFDNDVTLSWDRSSDAQTYYMGLTYNLYIGQTPSSGNTKSSMSDNSTGFRKVIQLGNAGQFNSYTIKDLPLGTYYWSVQAVDPSYKGSLFATEGTFVVSSFSEMPFSVQGLGNSFNSWGDYDNDGDLDVLVSGTTGSARFTEIYRNDGSGTFTDTDAGIVNVYTSTSSWGDYDNDGDLDIAISGHTGSVRTARIYRNDSGVFTDINAGLIGVNSGSLAWGDYDNDGDLDLLLTGYNGTAALSGIYRNDNGIFTDISAGLTGVYKSSATWADYDNDGDLDILITGLVTGVTRIAKIYRNEYGYFYDISAGLTGVQDGNSAWGDFDNDGDQDILITGNNTAKIYRNDGWGFTEWGVGFTGVNFSSAAWGDYDNDGDLDAMISGLAGTTKTVKVYRNEGWGFTDIGAGLIGIQDGCVTWVDYDNDRDLDIFYTGYTGTARISRFYRNNAVVKNTAPSDPVNLSSVVHTDGSVTFSWDKASDSETSQNGLSYNLYISSTSMGLDQMSPMSDLATGYRKVVRTGNIGQRTSWTIKDLPTGHFYWSVQAVDNNFAGSSFSGEQEYSAFTDISAGLEGVAYSSSSWGDYDSDGDIDIAISGTSAMYGYISRIYRNNNIDKIGPFSNIGAALMDVSYSSSAWGDYDNDGDLDLAVSGYYYGYYSKIYRNDAGIFTDIAAPLAGVHVGSTTWGDYDNDGDLDLLLTGYGYSSGAGTSKVYRNDSGTFTDISAPLDQVYWSSGSSWVDYDNDGDLDILLIGYSPSSGTTVSRIYRNDSGSFNDISAAIDGVHMGSASWGDYDNDGDLDILLTGYSYQAGYISRIYRNDSGIFTNINAGLTGVYYSSAAWGDYDNDGDLDVLLTGNTGSTYVSKIYRNDSGTFTDTFSDLPGVYTSSVTWADYDNDGDLDILISGYNTSEQPIASVYRNNTVYTNPAVSAPTDLAITGKLNDAVFSFTPAYEKKPAERTTYNMDISIAGANVKTSMSDHTSGYRKLAEIGNLNFGNSADKKGPVASSWNLLKNMPNTVLPQEVLLVEAAVQSVDNSFAGSTFATASAYLPNRDLKTLPKEVMVPTDELLWELFWSDSLESYTLQVDEDSLFSSPYEETQYLIAKDPKIIYVAIELQNLSFFGSMTDNTIYFWRVRPNHKNHAKTTVFNSNPDSFLYNPVLSAPQNVAVASIDGNSVVLTWDPVQIPDVEYSVYSSSLPYASFPSEWTLEASKLGNTTCTVNSGGAAKKFFIVTATDALKTVTLKKPSVKN